LKYYTPAEKLSTLSAAAAGRTSVYFHHNEPKLPKIRSREWKLIYGAHHENGLSQHFFDPIQEQLEFLTHIFSTSSAVSITEDQNNSVKWAPLVTIHPALAKVSRSLLAENCHGLDDAQSSCFGSLSEAITLNSSPTFPDPSLPLSFLPGIWVEVSAK
jgi:hypothetical protein